MQPNRRAHWHDPLIYGAVAGSSAALGALGPRLTHRPIAELGELFSRSPLNKARLARCVDNIRWALPDVNGARALRIAHESYRHLFLLAAEASMRPHCHHLTQWPSWIELGEVRQAVDLTLSGPTILITGHCGNWELMGSWLASLGLPLHAVYRKLDNQSLDAWIRRSRARHGIHLIDKFGAIKQLPGILARGEPIGFTADQNARNGGICVPFFDRFSSSYKSIGLLAMRYNAPILCGVARRISDDTNSAEPYSPRFTMDIPDIIRPEDWADQPDPLFYITARYRRAIEQMIRSAPGQYLWMHRAWKTRPRHEQEGEPMPAALIKKLESLPWMTPQSLDRIITRSEQDAAAIAASLDA
jgi:Kdo2-lipid IVA lauroyltransferase/acyltransferase